MCGPIFDERSASQSAADRIRQRARGYQAPVEVKPEPKWTPVGDYPAMTTADDSDRHVHGFEPEGELAAV